MRRLSGELLGCSPEEQEKHHESITNPIKGTRAVNHRGNLKPGDSDWAASQNTVLICECVCVCVCASKRTLTYDYESVHILFESAVGSEMDQNRPKMNKHLMLLSKN